MRPGDLDTGGLGKLMQTAGGRVPVHPGAATVEQDRPARAVAGRPVYGPADRWRQRDQDDLGALAAYAQDPVAVLFAEVGDVGSGRFEDAQAGGARAWRLARNRTGGAIAGRRSAWPRTADG
jgi:hypothetical protein